MALNPQNLVRDLSPDEARTNGKKGGVASGRARRKRRDLKQCLKLILEAVDEKGLSGAERLSFALFTKAIVDGDVRAFSEIRDTVYGKPVSTVEMTGKGGSPLHPPALEVVFTSDDKKNES